MTLRGTDTAHEGRRHRDVRPPAERPSNDGWEAELEDTRPHTLRIRLHVERISAAAEVMTFQEMCGDTAYIPPSQLTFVKKIGAGSFAKVEICKYQAPGKIQQIVAVKRLRRDATADVTQFASEANTLRRLKHPSIVGFLGVGCSDVKGIVKQVSKTKCYIVQEFMDGGTLKQKIWSQARLLRHVYSDREALQWAHQIARGLAYLHRANPVVLHRDLKLENILLKRIQGEGRRQGFVAKICDFGLAVSVLEYHAFQEPTLRVPSGLTKARIDAQFHDDMRRHARGSLPAQLEVHLHAEKLSEGLKRMSAHPSFRRGKRMMRGTPVKDDPEALKAPRVASRLSSITSFLSRVSSESETADTPQAPAPVPSHLEAYNLTGRAGSYLYMAPEVIMCRAYNEKVDVFSLGVILLELFLRKPLAAVLSELDPSPNVAEMFAYKVAAGYRHPLPKDWPAELRQLISDCWHQEAAKRPTAEEVATRLAAIDASGVLGGMSLIMCTAPTRCCW